MHKIANWRHSFEIFFVCTTSSQISRQFRQYITRFAHVVNSLSRQYSLFIKDYVGYVWICLRNSETKDMYLLIFWRNMIFFTALSTMKMVRGAWYFSSQGEVLKHLHNFNINCKVVKNQFRVVKYFELNLNG